MFLKCSTSIFLNTEPSTLVLENPQRTQLSDGVEYWFWSFDFQQEHLVLVLTK